MTTSHEDLNRSLGRMEGSLAAVESRLDRIDDVLERIEGRLAGLEQRESAVKGAWKTLTGIGALVGGAVAWALGFFVEHWK